LKNTNKNYGKPNLTGKIIESEKYAGIQAKTTATKKPDKDNKKKDDKKGSDEWHEKPAVVDMSDFRDGLATSGIHYVIITNCT